MKHINASKKILALLLSIIIMISLMPVCAAAEQADAANISEKEPVTLLSEDEEVNVGVVCKLTPKKASYKSGEAILFILNTQYADPGSTSAPQTVKLGISLPDTTPAV